MTTIAHAYISEDEQSIYYLAYDLMLARVPLREGVAVMAETTAVAIAGEPPEVAARYEAIRAELLEVMFAGDDAWAHVIREARTQALELAARAGLDSPPSVDRDRIRMLELGGKSRVDEA